MSPKLTRELLTPMVKLAAQAAASLPPADRADVYDGIAAVTASTDKKLSKEAKNYASALRESEALQLHFQNLFRD